mgnify:CR=1 FL=1
MRIFYILIFFITLSSCKPESKKLTAQEIIDKTIELSGANKVATSIIKFKFRDKEYGAYRKNGAFTLSRSYEENTVLVEDVINNVGFEKLVNMHPVKVADSMAIKYSNSVNSVHYFSVLPHGLNDKAVHKKLLAESTIKGEKYYKVEVSFSEEGGGEDFEDIFIYWVGKEDFLIDYLAYSYHTNGGGKRFRVLKEQCYKEGIRFVDYHNYKPKNASTKLENLDKAFENSQLKKLSEINLENIQVVLLN